MAIICFDVDNTVVDSGHEMGLWLGNEPWYQDCFSTQEEAIHYATTMYTPWEGINLPEYWQKKAADWWKQERLYDYMRPSDEVMASIEALHRAGFTIIFASHVEGAHAKSKVQLLKRYFPYMEAFMATRQKHFVRCDYLVDDRASNLGRVTSQSGITPVYLKTCFDDSMYGTMIQRFDENIAMNYMVVDSIKEFSEKLLKR